MRETVFLNCYFFVVSHVKLFSSECPTSVTEPIYSCKNVSLEGEHQGLIHVYVSVYNVLNRNIQCPPELLAPYLMMEKVSGKYLLMFLKHCLYSAKKENASIPYEPTTTKMKMSLKTVF